MESTIAVDNETLKLLRKAKEELKVSSLNLAIKRLLIESKKSRKSMFGVLKNVKKEFRREKIDRFD